MSKSYRKNIHGVAPYFDDYNEDKKFLRILSKPGLPLQARELTQLQTILQNQIERLGDHFFKDGAVLNGGEIKEGTAVALRLSNNEEPFTETQLKSFIGKQISSSSGTKAEINAYALQSGESPDSTDVFNDPYQILFVNYTTGGEFNPGETLTIQGTLPPIEVDIKDNINSPSDPPAISIASNIITVSSGFFYIDGFIVKSETQTFAAYGRNSAIANQNYRRFDNVPLVSVGFKINREVVTSSEDETLRDPSFGFYNFNSPGADRYRIDLQLTQFRNDTPDFTNDIAINDDFFEVVRIIDSQVTKKVRYTDYAILEDTLARRTYDESGNYTVRPFAVTLTEFDRAFPQLEDDITSHAIQIYPGKAYVVGYEFETIAPISVAISRSLTTSPKRIEYSSRVLNNTTVAIQQIDTLSSPSDFPRQRENQLTIIDDVDDLPYLQNVNYQGGTIGAGSTWYKYYYQTRQYLVSRPVGVDYSWNSPNVFYQGDCVLRTVEPYDPVPSDGDVTAPTTLYPFRVGIFGTRIVGENRNELFTGNVPGTAQPGFFGSVTHIRSTKRPLAGPDVDANGTVEDAWRMRYLPFGNFINPVQYILDRDGQDGFIIPFYDPYWSNLRHEEFGLANELQQSPDFLQIDPRANPQEDLGRPPRAGTFEMDKPGPSYQIFKLSDGVTEIDDFRFVVVRPHYFRFYDTRTYQISSPLEWVNSGNRNYFTPLYSDQIVTGNETFDELGGAGATVMQLGRDVDIDVQNEGPGETNQLYITVKDNAGGAFGASGDGLLFSKHWVYKNDGINQIRTKTVVEETLTTHPSASDGTHYAIGYFDEQRTGFCPVPTGAYSKSPKKEIFENTINLGRTDVFEIVEIRDRFRDVTNSFELIPNHDGEAYYTSLIRLKPGFTCETFTTTAKGPDGPFYIGTPAGSGSAYEGLDYLGDPEFEASVQRLRVDSIKLKRFSHSGDGPFTIDSYPIDNDFTYDDIPFFKDQQTGQRYRLSDAIDFRPVSRDWKDIVFNNGSDGPQVVFVGDRFFESEINYVGYDKRKDKLVIDENREFKLVKGVASSELDETVEAPVADNKEMVVAEFEVPPYTFSPEDIKTKFINNQRKTMVEINELEKDQLYDQYFSVINDARQGAINRALTFRADQTAVDDGVFVDTFIGHNNTITSERDHNCAIDPINNILRPAFESQFYPLIGASSDGELANQRVKRTADNVFCKTYTDDSFAGMIYRSETIQINSTGIPDYQGILKISPSSDPYFSTVRKPKVFVNVFGEVDNWVSDLSAYQRGRTRGFGSTWRDWECHWFGATKRKDIDIRHDSAGSDYSAPRRSSYVTRLLSDKLLSQIGNKIVDLSVVPYVRSRTITFNAKNLKPFRTHSVYFDGVLVVASAITDANGEVSGSFDIARSTYLTGEKLVRISDSANISTASSSADAIYRAQGLIDLTDSDGIISVRPSIIKRKAANSEDVSEDYFASNLNNNTAVSLNTQTPLAMEMQLLNSQDSRDIGNMLSKVQLHFAKKPDESVVGDIGSSNPRPTVTLSIRPIYNGRPHPYKVLPFSEVVVNYDDILISPPDQNINPTEFVFDTPVFIPKNQKYALCIQTNSPDYELWTATVGETAIDGGSIITAPSKLTKTFLPSNNGEYTERTDFFFRCNIYRCDFGADNSQSPDQTEAKLRLQVLTPQSTFIGGFDEENPVGQGFLIASNALYLHSSMLPANIMDGDLFIPNQTEIRSDSFSENSSKITQRIGNTSSMLNRTFDDFSNKLRFTSGVYNPNISPVEIQQDRRTAEEGVLEVNVDFKHINYNQTRVAPMIDGDRLGLVSIENMANKVDVAATTEEVTPDARFASSRSRYVGRKVSLSRPAENLMVFVEGQFAGKSAVKVFVRVQGSNTTDENFDSLPWTELYPNGIWPGDNEEVTTDSTFQELKVGAGISGNATFIFSKATSESAPPEATNLGTFTAYQVKLVLMGQTPDNRGNSFQVPRINSLAAVPLKKQVVFDSTTGTNIFRYVPVGTILPYAGAQAPEGYLFCNGAFLSTTDPNYTELYSAIGTAFGSSGNQFRLPDLRGRVPIGAGFESVDGSSVNYTRGEFAGEYRVLLEEDQVPLPPHYHGFAFKDGQLGNNDVYLTGSDVNNDGTSAYPGTNARSTSPYVRVMSRYGPETTGWYMTGDQSSNMSIGSFFDGSGDFYGKGGNPYLNQWTGFITTFQMRPAKGWNDSLPSGIKFYLNGNNDTEAFIDSGSRPHISPRKFERQGDSDFHRYAQQPEPLQKHNNLQPVQAVNYIIKY